MDEGARFRLVDELFRGALREPPGSRDAYLARRCAGDAALRADVEALLAEDARTRAALDEPVMGPLLGPGVLGGIPGEPPDAIPERIGAYRVVARLGSGGMGTVYEAEQQNPRRQVAVKVVSPGSSSAEVLRRFEFEAQLLGRLQHPGIAQIYEAGVCRDEHGARPYFAMELVRGVPVTEYASGRSLGMRDRLRLVAQIADAVHHAHQRGVIHRDLKPGNILVDEGGRPRVLDFGVARVMEHAQGSAELTAVGQLVGTVSYMSPEQAGGNPDELDTRTDVYSLGVIAYELLTGRLPYELRGASLQEAVRTLGEREATPMGKLDRSLRGDIERVVGKALEKDRARRYDSASAFAQDIRRYLADEPVAARPPSTMYQVRKFSRRHRAGVAAGVVLLVSLVAGLVVTSVLLERTRRALRKAERQTSVARAVQSFMHEDLIGAADSDNLGPEATIRQAIDAAATHVDERFTDEPAVAAAVHASLGNIYWSLGDLERGINHLRTSKQMYDELGLLDDEIRLYVLNDLADFYLDVSMVDEAEPLLLESLARCRRIFGVDGRETHRAELELARVASMQGDVERAERELRALLPRVEEQQGTSSGGAARVLSALGALALESDRPAEAEQYYKRTLDIDRKVHGPGHSLTMTALNNLAVTYEKLGRLEEAAAMHEESLAQQIKLNGREHPETLPTIYNLASVYFRQGRYAEAEPMLVEVLGLCEKTFGEEHIGTVRVTGKLADLYVAMGRLEEALPFMERGAALSERVFGPDDEESTKARQEADKLRELIREKSGERSAGQAP